ncbi:MAG: ATP-binding protein [Myxococcota bacterium]|nr:ATP-binding protein [Myxococcota bacterium]
METKAQSNQYAQTSSRLGVRSRLLIGLAIILVGAGGLSSIILIGAASQEAEEQLLRQHRLRFDALVETIRHTQPAGFKPKLERRSRAHDMHGLVVVDHRFRPIHGFGVAKPLMRDVVAASAQQSSGVKWRRHHSASGAGQYRFAQRVRNGDGVNLTIIASYSLDALQSGFDQRQQMTLLYLFFGLVTVLMFGAYLSGRLIVAPIKKLTDHVSKPHRDAEWPYELDTIGGPDEIQQLASAFGHLIRELDQKNEILADNMRVLEQTQRELLRAEKLATLGRLSAGVAHEIGNPLASIVGFLDYLKSEPQIDDNLRADLLRRMDREVERIRYTLRQLLDFGRPAPDEPINVGIRDVIERTLALLNYHSQMKHVDVSISGTEQSVYIDPHRLSQVLTNLFLNAASAIDGRGSIDVDIDREADFVKITVRDDGPGVALELRDSLFDPFVSDKPSGVGTGLGLYVAQQIIEGAGGQISLTELESPGASFTVMLPLVTG